jgi:hypothetical protein
MLQSTLRQLFALAEAYPDLKANQNFLQLQAELSDLENKIAAARRFFNNAAAEYNASRESFPAVVLAQSMGFGPGIIAFFGDMVLRTWDFPYGWSPTPRRQRSPTG